MKGYEKYDKNTIRMPRQNPYFCLKWLKIKAFGNENGICTPPLYPYFDISLIY